MSAVAPDAAAHGAEAPDGVAERRHPPFTQVGMA